MGFVGVAFVTPSIGVLIIVGDSHFINALHYSLSLVQNGT